MFTQKGNKSSDNFGLRNRLFALDAGWQLLIHSVSSYDQVINYFKMTDVDPRELILLFKDLY